MGNKPTEISDKRNREIILYIFQKITNSFNQTLFIVTNDYEFASKTKRIIDMEIGKLLSNQLDYIKNNWLYIFLILIFIIQ